MAVTTLEGFESIRVIRADGNLTIQGVDSGVAAIDASVAPKLTRNADAAEVILRSNATISVPAGITVEVEDAYGNLTIAGVATPLTVKRVRGNLETRQTGALVIHETVSGHLSVKNAHAVEGQKVNGWLTVESAAAITFSQVSGAFECHDIGGEVAIEKISGSAQLHGIRGLFMTRVIGGHLEIEDAADVEAGVVGGRVRATNLSGALRIGKIGGKLTLENVAGEIGVGFVGGHARLSRVGGALSLEEVGGAIDLSGPYPTDKAWKVRSRGRVSVEVDENASIELDAAAGWGRIRTYGVEAAELKWLGRNHLHGPIGPEPAAGARLKLAIESRGADVIIATATARDRDFSGRGYRARGFAAPFEELADEIGEDVPKFVRSVLDAAGKFVTESGGLSSNIVRDVKRSVSEGLREVERALGEIEESVPNDVGERLSKVGKEISDLVSQAVRGGSREARREMRERVRELAREMRDTIREAARNARERKHDDSPQARDVSTKPAEPTAAGARPFSPEAAARPGATEKLNRDEAIMEILAAVKDGRLEPDEADDLINAWMEVSRGTAASR